MQKRLAAIAVLTAAIVGGPAVFASTAEGGVLYTAPIHADPGDLVICRAVNMSSVRVPIKIELLDGRGSPPQLIEENSVRAVEPGGSWGFSQSGEPRMSVILHLLPTVNHDAYCRFTVTGSPATFIRGDMILHYRQEVGGPLSQLVIQALPGPEGPGRIIDDIIPPVLPPISR